MKRMFLTAAAGGAGGLLLAAVVIAVIARMWSSFSDNWLTAAGFLPVVGVLLGAALGSRGPTWPPRGIVRLLLALLTSFFSALSAHLAFLITVCNWYAERPEVAQAGFLSLFFHPSQLPALASTDSRSGLQSEYGALENLIIAAVAGFVLSFLFFWWVGRRRQPD